MITPMLGSEVNNASSSGVEGEKRVPLQAPTVVEVEKRSPLQPPTGVEVEKRDPLQAPTGVEVEKRSPLQPPTGVEVEKRAPLQAPIGVEVEKRSPIQPPTGVEAEKRAPLQAPTGVEVEKRSPLQPPTGVEVEKRAPLQPVADPETNFPKNEIKPLSGNPYFDVILPKSAVNPGSYSLGPPASLKLPCASIPTVLNCGGKSWDMMYNGKSTGRKFFYYGGWKKFVEDNCLKEGDACIFELMEQSEKKLVFEVQILRGDIPSVFLEREKMIGESALDPIIVD